MHFSFFSKTFLRPALNISRHVRAFHDVKVGDNVLVKRKITPEDVKNFADLTGDHNSVHTRCEKPIVHGAFLNGLVSGVIGTRLPGCGTLVCNQDLKFPEPCHVGEEVNMNFNIHFQNFFSNFF